MRKCPNCDFDNSDYPGATYCGKCGQWLEPEGYTMLGGTPTRRFHVPEDIALDRFVPTDYPVFSEADIPLLAFADVVVFAEGRQLSYRGFADFNARLGWDAIIQHPYASTPVYLRPFVYSAVEGKVQIYRPNTDSQANYLTSQIQHAIGDRRIHTIETCTPLCIDEPQNKLAIWGFYEYLLIIWDGEEGQLNAPQRFETQFIAINGLQDGEAMKSPVRWQNQIVFLTTLGRYVAIDITDPPDHVELTGTIDERILNGLGLLSAACVVDNWLVCEGLFADGSHSLYLVDLRRLEGEHTSIELEGALPGGPQMILGRSDPRYQYSPIYNPQTRDIIVSRAHCDGFYCVNIGTRQKRDVLPDSGRDWQHWSSIVVNRYLLTPSEGELTKIELSGNQIRKIDSLPLDAAPLVPPVYYDNKIFILTGGNLTVWTSDTHT